MAVQFSEDQRPSVIMLGRATANTHVTFTAQGLMVKDITPYAELPFEETTNKDCGQTSSKSTTSHHCSAAPSRKKPPQHKDLYVLEHLKTVIHVILTANNRLKTAFLVFITQRYTQPIAKQD
jgi:hypothetical protein